MQRRSSARGRVGVLQKQPRSSRYRGPAAAAARRQGCPHGFRSGRASGTAHGLPGSRTSSHRRLEILGASLRLASSTAASSRRRPGAQKKQQVIQGATGGGARRLVPRLIMQPLLPREGGVLVSVPAHCVPIAAVGLATAAILICYVLAASLGHVDWGLTSLPDITHCALELPERAVFIGLFIPSCFLQALSWALGSASGSISAAASDAGPCNTTRMRWLSAAIGVAACSLLIIGESVLDPNPPWAIHIAGASGFFS